MSPTVNHRSFILHGIFLPTLDVKLLPVVEIIIRAQSLVAPNYPRLPYRIKRPDN